MRTSKKPDCVYSITWKLIHIVAFLAALVIVFLSCCGFGFGPGLSPPLDIHIPTKDDIYEAYEEAQKEADYDEGYCIELPDAGGNMVEHEFY